MRPVSQTLGYVFRTYDGRRQVLLGRKLRGFGAGKIMAPGGHVDDGETGAAAAIRELHEEVGVVVDPAQLSHRATIDFRFPTRPRWDAVVGVYVGERWTGPVQGSDELEPSWYDLDDLPFDRMWDDDRYWLPRVLRGERIDATITYDDTCSVVAEARITEVAGPGPVPVVRPFHR